jgi:hypothetical protein
MYDESEYLTATQVAELLGIKPGSFRTKVHRGSFPGPDLVLDRASNTGSKPLWLKKNVEKYLGE